MGKLADINAARREAAGVMDRFGRPLEVGDIVTASQQGPVLVKVMSVQPQLDPSGPKGHILHGMATYQFFAPPGQPLPDLMLVLRPEKREDAQPSDIVELKPPPAPSLVDRLRRWRPW